LSIGIDGGSALDGWSLDVVVNGGIVLNDLSEGVGVVASEVLEVRVAVVGDKDGLVLLEDGVVVEADNEAAHAGGHGRIGAATGSIGGGIDVQVFREAVNPGAIGGTHAIEVDVDGAWTIDGAVAIESINEVLREIQLNAFAVLAGDGIDGRDGIAEFTAIDLHAEVAEGLSEIKASRGELGWRDLNGLSSRVVGEIEKVW